MAKTIYVSYATPDYMKRLKVLHDSLTSNGIPKDRIDFSSLTLDGDWYDRVKRKIRFMMDKSQEYSNSVVNLAWIDADAVVVKHPVFLETFNKAWGMATELRGGVPFGHLSNCYIVKICAETYHALELWEKFTLSIKSRTPTQTAFKHMLAVHDLGFEITDLPLSYCWYEPHKDKHPWKNITPIIVHDIASRKTLRKSQGASKS